MIETLFKEVHYSLGGCERDVLMKSRVMGTNKNESG